jgi:hypothetical protein
MYFISLLFQLLNFAIGKGLAITCASTEWQLIYWVLRLFFVENVAVTVMPVWVISLIRRQLRDRSNYRDMFLGFWMTGLASLALKDLFHCGL